MAGGEESLEKGNAAGRTENVDGRKEEKRRRRRRKKKRNNQRLHKAKKKRKKKKEKNNSVRFRRGPSHPKRSQGEPVRSQNPVKLGKIQSNTVKLG